MTTDDEYSDLEECEEDFDHLSEEYDAETVEFSNIPCQNFHIAPGKNNQIMLNAELFIRAFKKSLYELAIEYEAKGNQYLGGIDILIKTKPYKYTVGSYFTDGTDGSYYSMSISVNPFDLKI